MRDSVTPDLVDVVGRASRTLDVDHLARTLDLGTRWVERKFRHTSSAIKAGVHALDNADGHGRHLIEGVGTLSQPHPMQVPPLSRDWNYRPSALESAMAARRMVTEVEFTGDIAQGCQTQHVGEINT
ncbi:hypothetical protein [Nocardia gipuzkoensis]